MRVRTLLFALLTLPLAPDLPPRAHEGPRLWLWAWERPEDLRFLAGRSDVGVALLVRTVVVGDDGVKIERRRQPALLPEGIWRVAVTRVEILKGSTSFARHAPEVARAILDAREDAASPRVQIDFDARPSQLPFYRDVLDRVRAALPAGDDTLSITAMASWCMRDGPLSTLGPVRAVPMAFAMGKDADRVRLALSVLGEFPVRECRDAVGVAADEPIPRLRDHRPVWAFTRRPWTEGDVVALADRGAP